MQPKLGGAVLMVEGDGRETDSGEERFVHTALGITRYDRETEGYRIVVIAHDGRTRYTMRLNEQGQWHEIGEITRDGGQAWFTFLEMTLDHEKVGEKAKGRDGVSR